MEAEQPCLSQEISLKLLLLIKKQSKELTKGIFLSYIHSYHLAEKKIKHFDKNEKKSVKPEKNNGVKFELFYFDVFEETNKFALFQTIRADEFAPVKNAAGDDSPASAKELLRNLHMKWIKNAGIEV